VTRLVSALHDADVQQEIPWLWTTGIIGLSLVIGSLWPIWLRFFKFCCAYIQQRMNTFTTQNSNSHGIELEAKQDVTLEERIQGTHSGSVPEITSSTLTVFVKHEVVTGDCP